MRKQKHLIILALIMLAILPQCKKSDLTDPAYAIGIITDWRPGIINNLIAYKFYVNGTEYDNTYVSREFGKKWKIPNENYNLGDQYMVQFNVDDPSCQGCSRMLFSYKVTDSADYKSYVNEFKTNPPQ